MSVFKKSAAIAATVLIVSCSAVSAQEARSRESGAQLQYGAVITGRSVGVLQRPAIGFTRVPRARSDDDDPNGSGSEMTGGVGGAD